MGFILTILKHFKELCDVISQYNGFYRFITNTGRHFSVLVIKIWVKNIDFSLVYIRNPLLLMSSEIKNNILKHYR